MIKFTVKRTLNMEQYVATAPEKVAQAVRAALYQEASAIMTDSKSNFVPVDTGNLRASGTVLTPTVEGDQVSIRFGYGGPAAAYARAVHENPRAGKTGGRSPSGQKYTSWAKVGQWKYLEIPFKNAKAGLAGRIMKRVRSALSGST